MDSQLSQGKRDILAHAGFRSLAELAEVTAAEAADRLDANPHIFGEIAVALHEAGLSFKPLDGVTRTVKFSDSIDLIDFKLGTRNKLRRNGVHSVSDLVNTNPAEMQHWLNVGFTMIKDVYIKMAESGLQFGATSYDDEIASDGVAYASPKMKQFHDELVYTADMQRHLQPDVTLREVLEKVDPELLDSPAASYLANDPETTGLDATVRKILSEFKENAQDMILRRFPVEHSSDNHRLHRETLQDIANDHDVSRERVRQVSDRANRRLAKEPLIVLFAERLKHVADNTHGDPSDFEEQGFKTWESAAAVLAAAIELGRVDKAKYLTVTHPEAIPELDLEYPIFGLDGQPETEKDAITQMTAIIKEKFTCGDTWELHNIVRDECGSALTPIGVKNVVNKLPVHTRNDGKYLYSGSKQGLVDATALLYGPISLEDLEAIYDEVFKDVSEKLFPRRVLSKLHFEGSKVVKMTNGLYDHVLNGAEKAKPVADRMDYLFEKYGTDKLTINRIIKELIADDPTVQESTVRTYAASGTRFHEQDGLVCQGPDPLGSRPEMSWSMFRTPDGLWAWHSTRDDYDMYRSSTDVPVAFFGAASMTLQEIAAGRTLTALPADGSSPAVPFQAGVSATNVYLTSQGGLREVLDDAGVRDGDRYRLVITGEAEVRCERLEPVDGTNPATVIFSTLGLPVIDDDPSDAAIHAVGLSPAEFDIDELRIFINRRGEQFAEAYWAINPEDSDSDR